MGRVGSSIGARRERQPPSERKVEGKPTWNVLQKMKLRESRDSRLCSSVVPVRGWPRMKTGAGGSGCRRQNRAKRAHSTQPTAELSSDIAERKQSRGQYRSHSTSAPWRHSSGSQQPSVTPLRMLFFTDDWCFGRIS